MSNSHSNEFNSKGGTQNAGIGDSAIGQQNNTYSLSLSLPSSGEHGHKATIPRQLPALDAHFFGRDKELAELLDRLHPGKVVAICGPGGMGKSVLAAQSVHRLEPDRFPDGIVFHSFYHQASTEMALQTICAAFCIEAKANLAATVQQVLSGRRALLILDGAEQADDLPAVLRLHGACGVLITSRKRSDAQGARLDLTPLEDEDAAEVFQQYSGSAGDAASVQAICTILGGWPVGLRIAGRYLSTTGESAADYLKWLKHEPFKELASGAHQEENAALLLRRSVDAVSADARLVLELAGCLAFAPIAREPVAAILESDERRARTALNELVNYGLLERREERWQTSHALIHTYARTALALSTESLVRLAAYYIVWCRAQSKAGLPGYALLDAERAHCLRLMESCLASKLQQEVIRLVKATHTYLDRQGYWAELLAALSMNLTAAQQSGDRKDEGVCLGNLGYTCEKRGEREQALSWYEQSLLILRELGERKQEGILLNNMAASYDTQGIYELALQQYEQSLSIKREVGDRKGEGTTLNNIGGVYDTKGEWERALRHYEQCLPIRQEVGDKSGEGTTLNNIAVIYRAQGKPAKAIEYYEQALAICQQLGDRAGEAVTCGNIGLPYKDLGDLAKAEEYISHAVKIAEAIGHPSLEKYRDGLAQVQAARRG
jgi:tetratricopeptide (TPR) repeat protein